MHNPVHTIQETRPVATFTHQLQQVAYTHIPAVRTALLQFFKSHGLEKEETGKYLLTASEILTNLVKHPPKKAGFTTLSVMLQADSLILDIADDSTAFADFSEKCAAAKTRLPSCETMMETGYGLGCILKQHTHVSYTPLTKSTDRLNHFTVRDEVPPHMSKQKTVFLIDDDPLALAIEGRMLEDYYNVISYTNAAEALENFTRLKPDLIISDLAMPEMDGAELRRALTTLESGKETPFVFLSGNQDKQHMPYINALGIDDFLCKPVSQEHLRSVTERLLNRSAQIRHAVQEKMSAQITDLLKPSLPTTWGDWKMSSLHAVATAGGGDFILHHAAQGQMMIVLADVMGHGHMAKFFAYAYAGYLRSLFYMQDKPDAAAFLQRLSALTQGDAFLENTIMTCQCFQLFSGGRVQIVSAGHPRPLLIDAEGKSTAIDVAGPLPGLFGDSVYQHKDLTLKPGEKILFATDGFFSAFDRKQCMHEDLVPLIAEAPALPADMLAARLWRAFELRVGTDIKDDATLAIIEYRG